MSVDATKWAWQQQITATQKIVLLSLADRADENFYCFPSTKRLEADTCLYRETIFKAIKDMESLGLISVTRELGIGNKFKLNGVSDRVETSRQIPTSSKKPTSRQIPIPTSSDLPTTQSVNADTYQSANADTEPTIEPINNLSIEPNNKKSQKINFFAECDQDLFSDYLKVRKAKKAPPVSQTIYNAFVRESLKAKISLDEALRICIEKNWVGFNAEWLENRQRKDAAKILDEIHHGELPQSKKQKNREDYWKQARRGSYADAGAINQ
jgi:hypothetical protein